MSNLLTTTVVVFDAESIKGTIWLFAITYGVIVLGGAYLLARFGYRRGGSE